MANELDNSHLESDQYKRCIKCGNVRQIEDFSVRSDLKNGRRSECRDCAREKSRLAYHKKLKRLAERGDGELESFRKMMAEKASERRRKNPRLHAERTKNWRIRNPDKVAAYAKAYREINAEKRRQSYKDWALRNKDKRKAYKADEYQRNKEKYREKNRKFFTKNPGKRAFYARKHLAKIENRICSVIRSGIINSINKKTAIRKNGRKWESIVGYTVEELITHLERQFLDGMSWENYGKDGWEIDHIIPISSFTFTSVDDPEFKACWALTNLRPLWRKDNVAKRDKILTLL